MVPFTLQKGLFLLLAVSCALPFVSSGVALAAGILFSLLCGNPWPRQSSLWSKKLLQLSVAGLGFGLSLGEVWTVGKESLPLTLAGITLTLMLGKLLLKVFRAGANTGTLIAFGTAICGGSAIAAMAPIIKAKDDETAVALATVFVLNAVALLLFPPLGQIFDLSQQQFGQWAALAIHDTSSVVGATAAYGSEALAVGTVVKLTRALWIVPFALVFALLRKSQERAKIPPFIIAFVAAAFLHTLFPHLTTLWEALTGVARQALTLTLFLIGAGLSRPLLQRVGFAPLALGVSLWLVMGSLSLVAVRLG
jgi:uncharacterized integral membrane protein (TIGR00698 family)